MTVCKSTPSFNPLNRGILFIAENLACGVVGCSARFNPLNRGILFIARDTEGATLVVSTFQSPQSGNSFYSVSYLAVLHGMGGGFNPLNRGILFIA